MNEELIEHLQHDISLKDKQIEALKAQYNLSFNEGWRTRIELNALRTAFSKETDALRASLAATKERLKLAEAVCEAMEKTRYDREALHAWQKARIEE